MPTAGRLMAATLFAALAWHVSTLAMGYIPEGTYMTGVPWWNALFALLLGWRGAVTGPDATPVRGLVAGLTTGVVVAFWALLIHSGARMVDFSMRGRYGDAVEGFLDTFQIMFDYAEQIAQPDVLSWGLGGALLIGLVSANADRRWT